MNGPSVKRLDSGFWFVRWSNEIWAQWPVSRSVGSEDFFHPDVTGTEARMRQCDELTSGPRACGDQAEPS
jgi:hypothetical protein